MPPPRYISLSDMHNFTMQASFKDLSIFFIKQAFKAQHQKVVGIAKASSTPTLPSCERKIDENLRSPASPGGVEHLDIPVWSLHNARCALEFRAPPSLRASSLPPLFLHHSCSFAQRDVKKFVVVIVPLLLPFHVLTYLVSYTLVIL